MKDCKDSCAGLEDRLKVLLRSVGVIPFKFDLDIVSVWRGCFFEVGVIAVRVGVLIWVLVSYLCR